MQQRFDPRNANLIVNINGKLVHRDEAGVSPFDSSVQGGDAVWEGLRVYHGKIFKLSEHLRRLRRSAIALAFEKIPSDESIIAEVKRTLAANNMTDGVHIRLTLTRGVKITSGMDPRLNQSGPTLIVLAEFKPPVYGPHGIRLITSCIRRFPPECLDQKIHSCNLLQSILAKLQANAAGVDDALMLDMQGFVAETNATHVFAVEAGMVSTSFTHSCPEGITRDTIFELCRSLGITCLERNMTLAELYRAEELFCTGTMGEIVPVLELDGRRIGAGTFQITRNLQQAFARRTAAEGDPI
jgi:branched-chain amino acid aminotransferase